MAVRKKTKEIAEFGDLQTPLILAERVCAVLSARIPRPQSIVEPTCGRGSFLRAALESFPDAPRLVGIEINPAHVRSARALLRTTPGGGRVEVVQGDFFGTDWNELLRGLDEPILVIGNPPWVTSAALGTLGSANLPEKSNFQKRGGLDAITGKANFDISEWMLIRLLESLNGRRATCAMLCKNAVARKALFHIWKEGIAIGNSSVRSIDADTFFGAAVDACLLTCNLSPGHHNCDCEVYEHLGDARKSGIIGYRDGHLLANVEAYERWKHLCGRSRYKWRSGVKHDCSKVMELRAENGAFRNGLAELVELESEYVYPMLKSSEVASGSTGNPGRCMLVTQSSVGEDTRVIESRAKKTYKYLIDHAKFLDARGSSIYRKRPRFSVFGVGDYTFSQWKIAISGFYKRLAFSIVGPFKNKPVVFDDTVYFIPCKTREEAELVISLLNSAIAKEFFYAFIFWDAKRPITVEVLQKLDLLALAREMGLEQAFAGFVSLEIAPAHSQRQARLFK